MRTQACPEPGGVTRSERSCSVGTDLRARYKGRRSCDRRTSVRPSDCGGERFAASSMVYFSLPGGMHDMGWHNRIRRA